MTSTASAPAPRRRPFADPRLLIGLLLVVASVAATVGLVAAVDRRTQVYAASGPLEPGDRIRASDLVARGVALDGSDTLYLAVGRIPKDGLVVTRPVAQGELVPASSVGTSSDVDATTIVLRLATRVSGAVAPGASVDVWAAPPSASSSAAASAASVDGSTAAAPPAVLVEDAAVVRVLDDEQSLTVGRDGSAVEVRLPRSRIARVLAAIAAGDGLSIVPAGLGLSGRS
jgi:hypothetical protein